MKKRKNIQNKKQGKQGKKFWNSEYQSANHLAMSEKVGEDLVGFITWLGKEISYDLPVENNKRVLDIGCGNGRNSHYLHVNYGMDVVGFDISSQAISQAQHKTPDAEYFVGDIKALPYAVDDKSCALVIDMMASHILGYSERQALYQDIHDRLLEKDGWYFIKTFLLDGDINAHKMIREHPGPEKNSYVHPKIGHVEHVLGEDQIINELEAAGFYIHKTVKSHKHMIKGKPGKRRTICVYAQKS